MYTFYELDLSDVPPFQPRTRIRFRNGINQVAGGHMSGKTRLFEQLRATARSFSAEASPTAATDLPAQLMFWSSGDDLPRFWTPYAPLAEFLDARPLDLAPLADDLTFAFDQVLAERNAVLARVYSNDNILPESRYVISAAGVIEQRDAITGRPKEGENGGYTERCALYLALNWALRKQFPSGQVYPFVMDDRLAAMDNLQLDGLSRLMRAISRQVILIGSPGALLPDIEISHCLEAEDGRGTTVVTR